MASFTVIVRLAVFVLTKKHLSVRQSRFRMILPEDRPLPLLQCTKAVSILVFSCTPFEPSQCMLHFLWRSFVYVSSQVSVLGCFRHELDVLRRSDNHQRQAAAHRQTCPLFLSRCKYMPIVFGYCQAIVFGSARPLSLVLQGHCLWFCQAIVFDSARPLSLVLQGHCLWFCQHIVSRSQVFLSITA